MNLIKDKEKSMSVEIVIALISAFATIGSVIVTAVVTNKQTQAKLETSQKVTETRLDLLTEEVRKHNNFAERIPAIETRIDYMEQDIKELKGGKK